VERRQKDRRKRRERRGPTEPDLASPLDVAIADRDRHTLAMVDAALSRGRARLAFQPVMRADGGGVAFHEGLIRILDETGRIIPARDFMPAVVDHEIGRRIDCAALLAGLRALRADPSLRLAVNMSARSIGYPAWNAILRRFLRRHPEAVDRLILEMKEDSVMLMPELVSVFMKDLQTKGVTFALDDFGSGDIAMRHFRQLLFDAVKIDAQFVRGIDRDADTEMLARALIAMARSLRPRRDRRSSGNTGRGGDARHAWRRLPAGIPVRRAQCAPALAETDERSRRLRHPVCCRTFARFAIPRPEGRTAGAAPARAPPAPQHPRPEDRTHDQRSYRIRRPHRRRQLRRILRQHPRA
jgi:EAL domain-containing protein (putative c-di-GMP-specific phosphodiesterase class I)